MHRGHVRSSTAGQLFSQVPSANIPRSKFNRSHAIKTTFSEGYLIPIYTDEMVPGDTFNLNLQAFIRLATPAFPIMDNLYCETFFFAVPYRLLWNHWEEFNGASADPFDQSSPPTVYTPPQIVAPVRS